MQRGICSYSSYVTDSSFKLSTFLNNQIVNLCHYLGWRELLLCPFFRWPPDIVSNPLAASALSWRSSGHGIRIMELLKLIIALLVKTKHVIVSILQISQHLLQQIHHVWQFFSDSFSLVKINISSEQLISMLLLDTLTTLSNIWLLLYGFCLACSLCLFHSNHIFDY